MTIQPYLFFDGRTEEAVNFYKKAVGAEVEMMMRFKDSPEQPQEGCAPPAGTAGSTSRSSRRRTRSGRSRSTRLRASPTHPSPSWSSPARARVEGEAAVELGLADAQTEP